jgi:hypothetical protein
MNEKRPVAAAWHRGLGLNRRWLFGPFFLFSTVAMTSCPVSALGAVTDSGSDGNMGAIEDLPPITPSRPPELPEVPPCSTTRTPQTDRRARSAAVRSAAQALIEGLAPRAQVCPGLEGAQTSGRSPLTIDPNHPFPRMALSKRLIKEVLTRLRLRLSNGSPIRVRPRLRSIVVATCRRQ